MEARMTLCNLSIEMGARAGLIAPDETTFAYLEGRPAAPACAAWDERLAEWCGLPTDAGAIFDREVLFDAGAVGPMVSWGTNPDRKRTRLQSSHYRAARLPASSWKQ